MVVRYWDAETASVTTVVIHEVLEFCRTYAWLRRQFETAAQVDWAGLQGMQRQIICARAKNFGAYTNAMHPDRNRAGNGTRQSALIECVIQAG